MREAEAMTGKRASTRKRYEITSHDLPLSCPTRDMRLWDAHPRVWLPIDETGHEICPYCEAEFIMTDFAEFQKSRGHD